jgi:hypothetical protein
MDLTFHPEGSFEKLGPNPVFPIVIKYKHDATGNMNHITREYQKCGCYVHSPTFVEKIPYFCTLHDGSEPCFFSAKKYTRKLYQLWGDCERELVDLELRKQSILKKIERDRSPSRRKNF